MVSNPVKHRLIEMALVYAKKNRILHQLARILAGRYPGWSASVIERKLVLELSNAASADGPIIVGPWVSEVGFEVLYWVPFIKRYINEFDIDPARVTVLSRGGAGLWYQGFNQRYIEIFDLVTAQEFKKRNESRSQYTGQQKQSSVAEFERELISKARLTEEIENGFWLHPRYMYNLLTPYWAGICPSSLLDNYTCHELRPLPKIPKGISLKPGDYVAVKFYFSDSFPDNERNRFFIGNILHKLSKVHNVVVLNTGLSVDDHSEHDLKAEHFIDLSEWINLRTNLDFQTRIIANSKMFIGTYGGFSYIAPYYGVPSVAFFSEENAFSKQHLEAANNAFQKMRESQNFQGSETNALLDYNPVFMPIDVDKFNIILNSLFKQG
jgi:hypothetical protein